MRRKILKQITAHKIWYSLIPYSFGIIDYYAKDIKNEATQILLDALSKTDNPKALKGVILNQSVYQGLQGEIRIDKFGDVQRKQFLITVKDGRFVTLE